jgi:hypothetical protein
MEQIKWVPVSDRKPAQSAAGLAQPWRRYFARMLDISIYGIIWAAVYYLVFRWQLRFSGDIFFNLVSAYIAYGLMFAFEPIMLRFWGTTPGKWIFGLVIRTADGQRLSYSEALDRTRCLFGKGMGYGIPIYSIVRTFKSYSACKDGETLEWDEGYTYTLKDDRKIRTVGFIAASVLAAALNTFVILEAEMPLHRGELTPKEYYENCNDVMKRFDFVYGRRMNERGEWVDAENDGFVYVSGHVLPEHELTLTDGIVTGVRIEITDTQDVVYDVGEQMSLAILSFLAASDEMNCLRLGTSNILKRIRPSYVSFSFTEAGIRVTNEVEIKGLDNIGGMFLIPIEGETPYFHLVFTLEKTEP